MDYAMLISLLLLPVMGKLAELVVNLLKRIDAFAASRALVKQAVGLIVSLVITWLATLGYHFAGTTLGTITVGDVGLVLPTLITWVLSQLFHNGKKVAQLPAPPPGA